MKITVLLFAKSREIVGEDQIDYQMNEGDTVSHLIKKLQSQFPDFAALNFIIAVNTEYVEKDYQLHDGDQVAIIPPISGG
jgi:molybdopterin synthase sulfur carrier subunit